MLGMSFHMGIDLLPQALLVNQIRSGRSPDNRLILPTFGGEDTIRD